MRYVISFVNFANKVPFYCPIILCLDDPNLQSLIPQLERRLILPDEDL